MKYLTLMLLCFLCLATTAQGDYKNVRIEPEFKAVMDVDDMLMDGDVCRIAKINGELWVLSSAYGIADKPGFKAKKDASKVAELTAKRAMLELLDGQSISGETFMKQTEITNNDETEFKTFFETMTKSEVEGLLQGAQTAGSWELEDGGERVFFKLYALKVPKALSTLDPKEEKDEYEYEDGEPHEIEMMLEQSGKSTRAPSADGLIVVVAVGTADYMGNVDYSRVEALKEASREAVGKALGSLLKGQTVIQNDQVKMNRLYEQTAGAVEGYDMVEEGQVGDGSYRVKIRARVSREAVERSAKQVGLLVSQVGKPKVALIPYETMNGKRLKYDSSPMTTALNNIFLADPYNIRPIDMYQSMVTKKQQQPELWEKYQRLSDPEVEMDVIAFGELGFSADIIVKGEIFLEDMGKDSDGVFNQYEATVLIKILWAGTGEILGTIGPDTTITNGATPAEAMSKSVQKMVPRINPVVDDMIRQFQDIVNNGARVTVTMREIPKGRKGRSLVRKFKSGLEALPKVAQVEEANQSDGRLDLDVMFKGTPSQFKDLMVDFMDEELGDFMDDNEFDFDLDMKGGSMVIRWFKD